MELEARYGRPPPAAESRKRAASAHVARDESFVLPLALGVPAVRGSRGFQELSEVYCKEQAGNVSDIGVHAYTVQYTKLVATQPARSFSDVRGNTFCNRIGCSNVFRSM